MRTLFLFVSIFFATSIMAAGDPETCSERQGERSIAACTRLIATGKFGGNDLATLYVLRGAIYRSESNYDLAVGDFTKAIELLEKSGNPGLIASAYATRGAAYALKGSLESALADYRRALSLDGRNEQAAEGISRMEATLLSPASPISTVGSGPEIKCFIFNGERFCE